MGCQFFFYKNKKKITASKYKLGGTTMLSNYPTNPEIRALIQKANEQKESIRQEMLVIQKTCEHDWTNYSQNYNIYTRSCRTCAMEDTHEC